MKKRLLWALLDSVFIVVFNVVFFVAAGTEHVASVWISYGCIHFAYLMVLITPLLTRKGSSAAEFGLSIGSISSAYFLLEFVVGLVFIFLRQETIKAAVIIQVILAGIYAAVLLSHLIANESTADSVERHETEVAYVKRQATRLKALLDKGPSKQANKKLEEAYDLLHSSPTKSSPSVRYLEDSIEEAIEALEQAVCSKDESAILAQAQEVIALGEERNRNL